MQYTELQSLSIFELTSELATREPALDVLIADLQRLPLNGTPSETAAANELTAQMQAAQSTVTKMQRRLLELEPKKAKATDTFAYDKAYARGRHRPG